jgi:hypothetical protein
MGGISSMHRRYKYHIHYRSQNKINIRTLRINRRKWEDNIKMDLKYGARLWPELIGLTLETSYQHDKYKAYLPFPSLHCLFVSLYDWQKDKFDTHVCLYRFSNYEAAKMLVGTNSLRLVQRLRRVFCGAI